MTATLYEHVQPLSTVRDDPEDLLAALGKDPRLVPYGGGNFGMPLELMEPEGELIVPTERFFMRSNGPVPVMGRDHWTLRVAGGVERVLELRLHDLEQMPRRTLTAFLECAGNGRTRFDPVPEGTPWRNDAAGNAIWDGVPLAAVLDLAGVQEGAVDVVAQGGDFPEMRRGLPLAVARDPNTLLVLRMNGESLPVAHGGPVRLLVPGWAGIASTKWLIGLTVLDRAFEGFWNTDNYVVWTDDGTPLRPVTEMPVKSIISTPGANTMLTEGPIVIAGYAWSGYGAIDRVEVSTNGGETWQFAELERAGRRAWVRFAYTWKAAPGRYRLMTRATDERRLRQPGSAVWNAKGYGQNGIQGITVSVSEQIPQNDLDGPARLQYAHEARLVNG